MTKTTSNKFIVSKRINLGHDLAISVANYHKHHLAPGQRGVLVQKRLTAHIRAHQRINGILNIFSRDAYVRWLPRWIPRNDSTSA